MSGLTIQIDLHSTFWKQDMRFVSCLQPVCTERGLEIQSEDRFLNRDTGLQFRTAWKSVLKLLSTTC